VANVTARRPGGLLRAAVIGLVCIVAFGRPADAGSEPTLRVVLADDGAPAAVTVTAEAADGREHAESTLSRRRPVASFVLQPGDYEVGLRTADGQSAVARVWLEAGATVVLGASVAAGQPMLVPQVTFQSTEGARFNARALGDLPVDDLSGLVETAAPFVISDRMSTGGLGIGRSALLAARGESWTTTTVSVGGIEVRSPTSSGRLPAVGDLAFAEAVVAASGLSAVEIDTPGLVVEVFPKRGGRAWSGAFDASVTTPGMVGENAIAGAPSFERIEDWRAASFGAGGPMGERAGAFVSASFARATHTERDRPAVLSSSTEAVSANVDTWLGNGHRIDMIAAFEAAAYPYDDRVQLTDPAVDDRARFGRAQVRWQGNAGTGHISVAAAYQRGAWRPEVSSSATGGVVDRVFDGVVPRPPADVVHEHVDLQADWRAGGRRWGGTLHEVRAGVSLRNIRATRETLALPVVAETVQRQAARVWMPVSFPGASVRHLREARLYVADRLAVGSSATLDLGVRADLVDGSTDGSNVGLDWRTVSPRAALRWHVGALSLFAGGGRYTGGDPIAFLGAGDPGEVTWAVHRWSDPDGDGSFVAGEAGPQVMRSGLGPAVASLDPDLRAPRSAEWTAGVEVRPNSFSVLRGAIVIRRQTGLVGLVNTGLTAADFRTITIDDIGADEGSEHDDQQLVIYERLPSAYGRDALLLTNPADAAPVRHDGIEVTYELRSPRWLMIFGATAYRTVGRGGAQGFRALENDPLAFGGRYWNPNARQDQEGRLFFDRAYVGKWTTAYRAPGDVRLAAIVRYQDGQPFTRYAAVPDLVTGPEIVHAYPMGRTRFTYTATVDARIEKGFTWAAGRRASLRVDIFNLTNHANELEEDVWTGPSFRRSTIVQPPRTMRVGMEIAF
jgi:hypothetical protein